MQNHGCSKIILWYLKTQLNKGESLSKLVPSYGLRQYELTKMTFMKNLKDIQYSKKKAKYRITYTV